MGEGIKLHLLHGFVNVMSCTIYGDNLLQMEHGSAVVSALAPSGTGLRFDHWTFA